MMKSVNALANDCQLNEYILSIVVHRDEAVGLIEKKRDWYNSQLILTQFLLLLQISECHSFLLSQTEMS